MAMVIKESLESNYLESITRISDRSPDVKKGEKQKQSQEEKSISIEENPHPLRIFLCHSSSDKPPVRDLYKRLKKDGFDPWLDEENLLPGQKWQIEIPKAVMASDVVIVCLSHKAINKAGYIQKEIKDALDAADEQPEGTIFLIPLKLEECNVPERLRDLHWVNYFEDNGYIKLIRSLIQRAKTITADNDRGLKFIKKQTEEEFEENNIKKRTEPIIISKTFTNSIDMKFALIPAGEFMMGSEETKYEKPVHKVTISKPCCLGIYPVTQQEWNAIMRYNPSHFKGNNLPVERVSWNDVQDFIKKLNENEGTNKYRLPSEAEWEYAARAGTSTRYSFGDDESELGDYACYSKNSEDQTHPVGQKKPNKWGLFDMYGNVWEWVLDSWYSDYYILWGIWPNAGKGGISPTPACTEIITSDFCDWHVNLPSELCDADPGGD